MKKSLIINIFTLVIGSSLSLIIILVGIMFINVGNESHERHKAKVKVRQSVLSDFNGKTIVDVKLWDNNRHITFVFTDSTSLTIKSHKYSMKIVSK